MHSANAPHLGKRHVRPWVHDPGNLTDVCLMLTLGNPSPCLSLYPCLPAESRPKMTGWSDFRVRGRRLGGGALGPQGRSRVRHGHHKINSSHRSWCHPPQRDRPLQYRQLQQQKQEYPTCLLVHTVVKCPASGFSLLTFHSQPSLSPEKMGWFPLLTITTSTSSSLLLVKSSQQLKLRGGGVESLTVDTEAGFSSLGAGSWSFAG